MSRRWPSAAAFAAELNRRLEEAATRIRRAQMGSAEELREAGEGWRLTGLAEPPLHAGGLEHARQILRRVLKAGPPAPGPARRSPARKVATRSRPRR